MQSIYRKPGWHLTACVTLWHSTFPASFKTRGNSFQSSCEFFFFSRLFPLCSQCNKCCAKFAINATQSQRQSHAHNSLKCSYTTYNMSRKCRAKKENRKEKIDKTHASHSRSRSYKIGTASSACSSVCLAQPETTFKRSAASVKY